MRILKPLSRSSSVQCAFDYLFERTSFTNHPTMIGWRLGSQWVHICLCLDLKRLMHANFTRVTSLLSPESSVHFVRVLDISPIIYYVRVMIIELRIVVCELTNDEHTIYVWWARDLCAFQMRIFTLNQLHSSYELQGGGLYIYLYSGAVVTMTSCTVSNNTAQVRLLSTHCVGLCGKWSRMVCTFFWIIETDMSAPRTETQK